MYHSPPRRWLGPVPEVTLARFLLAQPEWAPHYHADQDGRWLPPAGAKAFIDWARAQGSLDAWSAKVAHTQVRQGEDLLARKEGQDDG